MSKGLKITSSKIDSMGKLDRFDMKFLIGRDPEYIKSILHFSLSNHFQGVFVLNVRTIRIKNNHTR